MNQQQTMEEVRGHRHEVGEGEKPTLLMSVTWVAEKRQVFIRIPKGYDVHTKWLQFEINPNTDIGKIDQFLAMMVMDGVQLTQPTVDIDLKLQ